MTRLFRSLLAAIIALSCYGSAVAQAHCPLHHRHTPNCGGTAYSAPAATYSAPAAAYTAPALAYSQPTTYAVQQPATYAVQQPVTYSVQQPVTYAVQQPTAYMVAAPQATTYSAPQTCGGPAAFNSEYSSQSLMGTIAGIGAALDLLERLRPGQGPGPGQGPADDCCAETKRDLADLERRVEEGFRDLRRSDERVFELTEDEFRRARGRLDALELKDSVSKLLPDHPNQPGDRPTPGFQIEAADAGGPTPEQLRKLKTDVEALNQQLEDLGI